ncbi:MULTISPECIES: HD domain-containing phosphohydrolase [unclassified Paenibacillus]|uniref:HD domain-containing phosphohydrolase n=1 Tax=unclassified Paenibacillus TaxID=185978 RepID=UPI000953D11F|nr:MULTISPECIES: HD domain-containing phosphohydrolase [unclassified Paenibacillus]ASS67436.1 HD domain-containing protein [Paenibacillus sp. RUD330]SIQ77047.1 HAMP domain-containing protein [Paenibacillus sp. RU4X]SIQ98459.1 HAMP domain-containing protein [Paenibacillus sp. RU4T]
MLSSSYRQFQRNLVRNYLAGSLLAVLGVGGAIIWITLGVEGEQLAVVTAVLLISLLIMGSLEGLVFRSHLQPIRKLFMADQFSETEIRAAYLRAHRLPILAVLRIMGPHMLGFMLPALILSSISMESGWLAIRPYFLIIAGVASFLVACLHALVEFFLTVQAVRPVLVQIRDCAVKAGISGLSLEGKVLVPIQQKFQLSVFVIGTLPVILFLLSTQIRQAVHGSGQHNQDWGWSGFVLVVSLGFASFAAWMLGRNIKQPIEELYGTMQQVRRGDLGATVPDLYSDEFSRLVDGFNDMIRSLEERAKMNEQLLQSYFSTLAAALDARDTYTAGHSDRVAGYALMIGRSAGLNAWTLDALHKTALLHDIGKIGVRDSVLLKEGRLTDEEFDQIKLHTVMGENILRQIEPAEAMAAFLPGVRSHHERYDGQGYPDGLSGMDIPMMGRIIAVADAFDAMTSDRPYRRGMPIDRALRILEEGSGTQWDPEYAKLFIDAMGGVDQAGASDPDSPARAGGLLPGGKMEERGLGKRKSS